MSNPHIVRVTEKVTGMRRKHFHASRKHRKFHASMRHLNTSNGLQSLGSVPPGSTVWLKEIPTCPNVQIRLAEMGITYSSPIYVDLNSGRGPIVVVSKNVKIILGRGLTEQIFVDFKE